jgi:Skp family chaperone for outer membrane proteins
MKTSQPLRLSMREICFLNLVTLFLAGLVPSASAAEGLPIALLNPDRIFKTHKPFQEKVAELQEEAKEVELAVQARQAELETVTNQLRRTPPGTPEFQKLQIQVFKLQNELQQYVNSERQRLESKNAILLLGFHRQLDALVTKHAKANGIKLVIRQQESSLEENQPLADIVKALNRAILYEEGLDITDQILKDLQAAAQSGGTPK